MSLREVLITPVEAKKLLERNVKNRKLSAGKVGLYAREMTEGTWGDCESMIMIDENGNLLNGQSRLHAIVESGKAQKFVIKTDCPPTAFEFLDQANRRSTAEVLATEGVVAASVVAGAARHLYQFERRALGAWGAIPRSSILRIIGQHPKLKEAARSTAAKTMTRRIAPVSLAAFWFYVLSKIDAENAEKFMDVLVTGQGGTKLLINLRNRLLEEKAAGFQASLHAVGLTALVFNVWNVYLEGGSLSKLVMPSRMVYPNGLSPTFYKAEEIDNQKEKAE